MFNYKKNMYDVVQVNEAVYATCDASNLIVSYNQGHNFLFELNHTGRIYFICSCGYCWHGLEVSVLIEPRLPLSSVAPSPSASSARPCSMSGVWWALAASLGATIATVLGLPF